MNAPSSPSPGVDWTINCIDCGGTAHLITTWHAEEPPLPGDVLVYRCSECLDRWDVVMPG